MLFRSGRVLARPSGTEPKIKFYADVVEAFAADEAFATVEARGKARVKALLDEVAALAG